ncbi:hypothetical protein GF342_05140 [Candidatus Woesearchaeota archaeon]|nr:hypothetical protein [Candidatus Woesearchaeota archaeon]
MKALSLTNKGIEPFVVQEIKELLGRDAESHHRVVLFEASEEEVCKFAYQARSVSRVLRLLGSLESPNLLEELPSLVRSLSLPKECTIDGIRVGSHAFNSQDVKACIQEHANVSFSYSSYKNMLFFVIIDEACYLGLDVAGRDLSKRDYKIFPSSFSLKGPLAYSLVRLASFGQQSVMLDPFCRDGTIAIEAALFASGQSPHYFCKRKFLCDALDRFDRSITTDAKVFASSSQFSHLSAAKKNAKIADMHKSIHFRKYAIDDLDILLDTKVTTIVTSVKKTVGALLHRADAMTVSKALVVVLYQQYEGEVPKGFHELRRLTMSMGKQDFSVLVFEKST